ncbi:Uma2 family endonuclease [Egbenema bharatensis]|uniref:Uma2 family endonuclease n=1 Tax=Egbenema bharatensis TaxID=3463334 RepID=UPI003A8B941E
MTQAKQQFQSFEEYLSYEDGTDRLYELFNGELVEVPPESGENASIAGFLFVHFALMLGHLRVRGHGLELEVRGEPKNRYPDLTILRSQEQVEQLRQRNTVRLSMAPPLLVVEVVSPGEIQRERDYIAKRLQYQDRGIPEYWIVDPQAETVLVLQWQAGVYRELSRVQGNEPIDSPMLGQVDLTATQIFAARGT